MEEKKNEEKFGTCCSRHLRYPKADMEGSCRTETSLIDVSIPEAIPIEENKMFGIPKPIKIKK